MNPSLSINNRPYIGLRYIIHSTEFTLGHSRTMQLSNIFDLFFGQLACMNHLAPIGSMPSSIFRVIKRSSPSEIINIVICWVSIIVTTYSFLWSRLIKRCQDKFMNFLLELSFDMIKNYLSLPPINNAGFKWIPSFPKALAFPISTTGPNLASISDSITGKSRSQFDSPIRYYWQQRYSIHVRYYTAYL